MRIGRISRLVFSGLGILVAPCPSVAETGRELEAKIQQWVLDLDAETYSIRTAAHQQLRHVGRAALPQLTAASKSESLEQRYRAHQIVVEFRRRELVGGFTTLDRQPDAEMDFDYGMWLIARILNHEADRDDIDRQLREMTDAVCRRLGKDVDPGRAPPREIVDTLIHVLKVDYKLRGNAEDYDNAANSSIELVLESGKGLPILLSHIAISVAQRMNVSLVGVPLAGRYMFKYDGASAPDGQPKDDIIIDPFGDWKILTPQQVKEIVPSFDATADLVASPRRETLQRMLRNLISDLEGANQLDKAIKANEYLRILQATAPVLP